MKKRMAIACAVIVATLTISVELHSLTRRGIHKTSAAAQSDDLVDVVSGAGTVEPISEDIKLDSEMAGKLKSVNVQEGDIIQKGQVLAELENDDYRAELESATAEMQAKEAALRKVVNGAQGQERSEASASARAAEAVMKNAQANLGRRRELFEAGVVSREELERYTKEYNVAKEQYQESADQSSLIDSSAREEDVAVAQADLQLSRAQVADAQAKYEKTILKSPIDGTVLRKHHRNGESVSNSATARDPILTIGDINVLRVRVDIDESDVNKIQLGQKAYITADAFGKQKYWGHVVQIGELLGPKNAPSDEPTARVDRKFLEALVELDPGTHMPIGLRVDSFILIEREQTAALRLQ
jgi:HlyD family secretion protein